MKRWNISHVIYYSNHGEKREIEFNVDNVTIITGASRTGKTYILDTIDYCLCSSDIDLSTLIKEKISYVAIKVITHNQEILIIREISATKKTSNKMFVEIGVNLLIPSTPLDFKGKITKDEAKKVLTDKIGITNFEDFKDEKLTHIDSLSIRQTVPYIYLDKETIDSKKHLLYGLSDINSAKYIIASIPYFLNAINFEELRALKKIKGLKKGIQSEEAKKSTIENVQNVNYENALSLYKECLLIGMVFNEEINISYNQILQELRNVSYKVVENTPFVNNDILVNLNNLIQEKTILLNENRRKRKLLIDKKELNKSIDSLNRLQMDKLNILSLFRDDASNCPVCSSNLKEPIELEKRIINSINILKSETTIFEENDPKLDSFIVELDSVIDFLIKEIKELSVQTESLIRESEILTQQNDLNISKSRTIGRISYFLENLKNQLFFDDTKLKEYNEEYQSLIETYNEENRLERIEEAEAFISHNTTKNLLGLPIEESYADWSLRFISKVPTIELSNNENAKVDKFSAIGSDENYLCIHLALIFALQKFFNAKNSPVPGFIILDQVSRPYYPKNVEQDIIDEDNETLNKIFNFIFDQVAKISGLQVIILEHANLKNNERYQKALKYEWPRSGVERLIPNEWKSL